MREINHNWKNYIISDEEYNKLVRAYNVSQEDDFDRFLKWAIWWWIIWLWLDAIIWDDDSLVEWLVWWALIWGIFNMFD